MSPLSLSDISSPLSLSSPFEGLQNDSEEGNPGFIEGGIEKRSFNPSGYIFKKDLEGKAIFDPGVLDRLPRKSHLNKPELKRKSPDPSALIALCGEDKERKKQKRKEKEKKTNGLVGGLFWNRKRPSDEILQLGQKEPSVRMLPDSLEQRPLNLPPRAKAFFKKQRNLFPKK